MPQGPRWFEGGWGELRAAGMQDCWDDGEGVLGRMGFAWRCSCGGAGEGVPWPLSGCPGKSHPDATDQE